MGKVEMSRRERRKDGSVEGRKRGNKAHRLIGAEAQKRRVANVRRGRCAEA